MKVALALAVMVGSAAFAWASAPIDAEVEAIARDLRCVVCQSLSVADSPSEMARQMREVIRDRLTRGETPGAVKAYFVSRYGEWVLLSPPARGFPLLAWVLPGIALGGGLAAALVILTRWSRRRAKAGDPDGGEVDDEDLAAVREEMRRRVG